MELTLEAETTCPHCGEPFCILIDSSQGSYSTVEDCSVCCRPMEVRIECEPGALLGIETLPN